DVVVRTRSDEFDVRRRVHVRLPQRRSGWMIRSTVQLMSCRSAPTSTAAAASLMPANPDRRLVRDPDAPPDEQRQQRHPDADQRSPDKKPDEAGGFDDEAGESRQNAAWKGAERGQQAELARGMLDRCERRPVSDEHDRGGSVGKNFK